MVSVGGVSKPKDYVTTAEQYIARLKNQSGGAPIATRHTWQHAALTGFALNVVVLAVTVALVFWMIPLTDAVAANIPSLPAHANLMAYIVIGYTSFLLISRVIESGSYVLYESVWCCTIGLWLASFAVLYSDGDIGGKKVERARALIGTGLVAVCCDQLMWYVDLTLWAVTGRPQLGVASYLTWPQTTFMKKLTATHHVWFQPLCFYLLRFQLPLTINCWLLSAVFTSLSSTVSRFFTPFYINIAPASSSAPQYLYANINAGHEFWKDVPFRFFHRFNRSPAYIYLPFLFFMGNVVLNGPPYLAIHYLTQYIFS